MQNLRGRPLAAESKDFHFPAQNIFARLLDSTNVDVRQIQDVSPLSCAIQSIVVKYKMYTPTPRECALLLLRLIEERENRRGEKTSRVRLAEGTLKHLWNRRRLTERFLEEVEDWLLIAGWVLIYSGSTYGAFKADTVKGWSRVSPKRLAEEIDQVVRGTFNFDTLEHLLTIDDGGSQTSDDDDE
jgi:hypothetical protein